MDGGDRSVQVVVELLVEVLRRGVESGGTGEGGVGG
jgi:hypothetical protein